MHVAGGRLHLQGTLDAPQIDIKLQGSDAQPWLGLVLFRHRKLAFPLPGVITCHLVPRKLLVMVFGTAGELHAVRCCEAVSPQTPALCSHI
jgi:hypothetical protein